MSDINLGPATSRGDTNADFGGVLNGGSGGTTLDLHSPYSDQSLGVLPQRWGQSMDFTKLLNAPNSMTEGETQQLQLALWKAGYYGTDAIINNVQPDWGTMSQADRVAWQQLLADAAHYQGGHIQGGILTKDPAGSTVRTLDELLQDKMQTSEGLFARAAATRNMDPSFVSLTDPAQISEHVRDLSRSRLGMDIGAGPADAIAGQVHGQELSVETANAQAKVDAQRAAMEAKLGIASGSKNQTHAPLHLFGGADGSASDFARGLAEKFGVTIDVGYTTANQSNDQDHLAGLKFKFQGDGRNIKALNEYLASQQGEGRAVAGVTLDAGTQAALAPPSTPPAPPKAKTTQDILNDYGLEVRTNRNGEKILAGPADNIAKLYTRSKQLSATDSGDLDRYAINELVSTTSDRPIATDDAGAQRGSSGNNILVKAVTAAQNATADNADVDKQAHVAMLAQEARGTMNEAPESRRTTKPPPPEPGAQIPVAVPLPTAGQVTVTFTKGAAVPKVEGLGLAGGGDDSINRFVHAVRSDNEDAWGRWDGDKVGAFGMDPRNYAAQAHGLGIDPADHSKMAQTRIARAYAQSLFNKYGSWSTVAHAWNTGELGVDTFLHSGEVGGNDNDTQANIVNRFGQSTKEMIDSTMIRMANPNDAAPPDAAAQIQALNAQYGQVTGGQIVAQTAFDPQSAATRLFEQQHGQEMQAYGVAKNAEAFASFLGTPGG